MNAPIRSAADGPGLRAIPASARIQAALREAILGMRLMPGVALSEKDIARSYGVSRTPVREALLRLAEERLVDIYPQVGTFVSRIRVDGLPDAMVIRMALERVTVRAAAERADGASRAELKANLDRQHAANRDGDLEGFYAADEEFHQSIARLAGHPHLWRVVKQEKVQVDRCRLLTLPQPSRRINLMAQHGAIADAIGAGDPDAAEAAMGAHLAEVLPSIDTLREAHPDYFEAGGEAPLSRPRRGAARP
ncbi:GntR family transcriptional regulator [Salinarimonas soli]|uniref:GntR family transcriptional regulator n=1 Tax=Salinarimonas soli TaxID=1638099 RepID=A0A5B2VGC1_9HYPH|nr:GntR family transcriptional regulator [Salinarimonas soli]KAA2237955.1 GntR family transcriptional regulator [Salinarimonas soli]